MTNTVQTAVELTPEEHAILLSAIELSNQEKEVAAQISEAKDKVIELFKSKYDTNKTGTIARIGKAQIQVKNKAGKLVLSEEILELQSKLNFDKQTLVASNAKRIEQLQQEILALQTSEEIQMMEIDLKNKIAALEKPKSTYEVAIKL